MSFYPRSPDYLPYLRRPTVDGWDRSPSRPLGYRRPLTTPGHPDGYPLTRDYGDYRLTRRMETSNLLYPRPPSPENTRKHLVELEGELKLYKDELARKEALIGDLKGEPSPHISTSSYMPTAVDQTEICSVCNRGNVLNTSKQEIEDLKSKIDNLQRQVKELESLLKARDKKIQELKHTRKIGKTGKQKKPVKMKNGSESDSSSSSESDHSDSVQEKGLKKKKKFNPDLESQLRELHDECRKLQKEISASTSKNDELEQENALLKQELITAKSNLENLETNQQLNHSQVTEERDAVLERQKHAESEVTVLQGRLDKSRHELSAARGELEQHMAHCSGLERERQRQESVARSTETQFAVFMESLARILSDGSVQLEPSEVRIRQRVEELKMENHEKTLLIQRLEEKVEEFSNRLDADFEVSGRARKCSHVHPDVTNLDLKLKQAENELLARNGVQREVHVDKEKFWHYLTRLCVALEMEPLTANLGIDEAVLTILARVEEIMKRDVQTLSKAKNHNAHLQLRLTRMADQMESKESHLELQRRKIASLEVQLNMRMGIEHEQVELEQENEFAKNRKMRKLIEKYRQELDDCHAQIRKLKSRLLYSNDVEMRTLLKDQELDDLENEVDERLWQAKRIAGSEHVVGGKAITNNTIHAMSKQLHTTKTKLQDVAKRESKLLELRFSIARMLGLDVTTQHVPDCEIISHLEKLIFANQANSTSTVALDDANSDLHKNFPMDYDRQNFANLKHHRRSRSLSPRRRLDRKAY